MKITKQLFCEILEILEEDGAIGAYEFDDDNSINVFCEDGTFATTYHFDEKNELIDPRIRKLQKQLEELEERKVYLKNQIKLLTNK